MKDKIYLIGQISVDMPITYEWRQEINEYFEGDTQFETIDPCRNEFNKSSLGYYAGKDADRLQIYQHNGIDLLVPKDKMYVMKSTMAIANMTQYDVKKPLIGTMFELAWYHDNNHKAVIGIYDGDPTQNIWCNHPFVQSTITTWVRSTEDACNIIEEYFRL